MSTLCVCKNHTFNNCLYFCLIYAFKYVLFTNDNYLQLAKVEGVINDIQDGNVLLRFGKPNWQDVHKSDDMVVTQHRPDRGNDQCNLVQK